MYNNNVYGVIIIPGDGENMAMGLFYIAPVLFAEQPWLQAST